MKHIYKIFLFIFFYIFLFSPVHMSAANRHALVIGIGSYQDKNWPKINGDRDAYLVNNMLRKHGYSDITLLVNNKATKAAIISSFNTLIKKSKSGDFIYIHFSGHGQQMTDFDMDEKDKWDECWIPYDAYRYCCKYDYGNKHLTDDEVNILLHRLKARVGSNGRIVVVVDACHSGDSTRGEEEEITRGVYDRFIPSKKFSSKHRTSRKENWIVLSACKDYQRNAEIKTTNGHYGKLTFALCKLIPSQLKKDNNLFYQSVVSFFKKNRGALPQTPTMEGTVSEFNITDIF